VTAITGCRDHAHCPEFLASVSLLLFSDGTANVSTWQLVGIRRAVCVLVVCSFVCLSGSTQGPGAPTGTAPVPNHDGEKTSERLRFIREFSSAQDVSRAHPVLDRTLDIIAGSKTNETAAEVLEVPYAVTTDNGHRVFVTDFGTRKLHVFDFEHSKYSLLKDGNDRLQRPVGVATDRDDNIYVTDAGSGSVSIYDARGKFRQFLKPSKGKESYFEGPWGIAIDRKTEHIYVCDSPRHMVIVLDKNGRVLSRFGKRGGGAGEGEFRFPTQIVAVGDEIVVLDSGNGRLQVLDDRGRFRRSIHLLYADKRSGLAVDEDRNIYVSDPLFNQIYVFKRDGGLLYAFGQTGTRSGTFNGVSGMWIDSGRTLYAVDAQNKRVEVFHINQNVNGSP